MNTHVEISELLPLYVSGALTDEQRRLVEQHLHSCEECQADLALWHSVSREIVTGSQAIIAPKGLVGRALAVVPPTQPQGLGIWAKLHHGANLLRSQIPLIQREIWPASALVIALGCIAAFIARQSIIIYVLAPLIAAACVSLIYGPENDPSLELALSTPTSPRQILLARLALVYGYNLGLSLVATLLLLPALSSHVSWPLFRDLVLAWLAPMTFLSAIALALSLWVGAANAATVAYLVWLSQLLAGMFRSPLFPVSLSPAVLKVLSAYQNFWQASGVLLILSALLLFIAIWQAGRKEQDLLVTA